MAFPQQILQERACSKSVLLTSASTLIDCSVLQRQVTYTSTLHAVVEISGKPKNLTSYCECASYFPLTGKLTSIISLGENLSLLKVLSTSHQQHKNILSIDNLSK